MRENWNKEVKELKNKTGPKRVEPKPLSDLPAQPLKETHFVLNPEQYSGLLDAISNRVTEQLIPIHTLLRRICEHMEVAEQQKSTITKNVSYKQEPIYKQEQLEDESYNPEESSHQSNYRNSTRLSTVSNQRSEVCILPSTEPAKTRDEWEHMYAKVKEFDTNKRNWSLQDRSLAMTFIECGVGFGYPWQQLAKVIGLSQSSYKRWKKMMP